MKIYHLCNLHCFANAYVFLCFCDLCIALPFYTRHCLSIEYQCNITVYHLTVINCKYCILELKIKSWHKKPFSRCNVHKCTHTIQILSRRSLTITFCVTVKPYARFSEFSTKSCAFDFNFKSHESSCARKKMFHEIIASLRRGGGGFISFSPPDSIRVNST